MVLIILPGIAGGAGGDFVLDEVHPIMIVKIEMAVREIFLILFIMIFVLHLDTKR